MLYEIDQHINEIDSKPTGPAGKKDQNTIDELMERIQRRDEGALGTLMRHCRPMLRSILVRILCNHEDVDDVLEEVFLGIWKEAGNFDSSKGGPTGWIIIITMASRRAIDRVRRRQAYNRAEMRFHASNETGTSQFAKDDVEREAEKSDAAAMFQRILSTLPPTQSAAVCMAFYRGLSQREISRETGIPLGTVKTRIELGVKKLRAAMLAAGLRKDSLSGVA